MAMFKSDAQGFLVGELVETNRDILKAQQQGMGVWRSIRADVKAIVHALDVQVSNTIRATNSSSRGVRGPYGPRATVAASGRSSSSGSPARASAATVTSAGRSGGSGPTAMSSRGTNGRFVASQKRNPAGTSPNSPAGVPGAGGGSGSGSGSGSFRSLSDSMAKLSGALATTENVDPTINAVKEVTDVVGPIGRGLFSLFGRNAERKKERWYQRIWNALTGRKAQDTPAAAASGGGGIFSALSGLVMPFVAAIGPMILGALGLIGATGIGAYIGTKIYEWLDKSGIATKIFDAFDAVKDWFKAKFDGIKTDYEKGKSQALQTGPLPIALGLDGRNINDPRRLDQQPIEGPQSVAQAAGRLVGGFQRGRDYMKGAGGRNVAETRAMQTGAAYAAGNIGGLDDAQTRALVASTALTESAGGKLGVENNLGFIGRYQAGAGWLADAGLIKGGSAAVRAAMQKDGYRREADWGKAGGMQRFLANDANWREGMSKDKYLGSATIQDAAFKTNSDAAYARLLNLGTINAGTATNEIAGLLKARHIAGMGGAIAVSKGGSGATDANGTSALKYYNDMALDRNGFQAAYRGSANMPALPNIPTPIAANVPSAVPATIPPPPEWAVPSPKLNTDWNGPGRVQVTLPTHTTQSPTDRNIAHIVTGGLGAP